MGLFDRLEKKLEDQEGGISALDLAALPPRLRKIMRLMLREVEMTFPQLVEATQEMDEADRLSDEELSQALDTLSQQGWLIRLGQDELITYKVNLRRKSGSGLSAGIWTAIEEKLGQAKEQPKEGAEDDEGTS